MVNNIMRAVGTFLIALIVAVGVEKFLYLYCGVDLPAAAAVATATLLGVGMYISNLGSKSSN